MLKLTLRQEAINDLTDIWTYTAENWSESQADKYYESIKLACREISNNPKLGKEYREIRRELFGHKINKHIIFYHIIEDKEIEVHRILHERMDIEKRLSEN